VLGSEAEFLRAIDTVSESLVAWLCVDEVAKNRHIRLRSRSVFSTILLFQSVFRWQVLLPRNDCCCFVHAHSVTVAENEQRMRRLWPERVKRQAVFDVVK